MRDFVWHSRCSCAELGIHPGHIIRKTLTIIHPLKKMERELADDQARS